MTDPDSPSPSPDQPSASHREEPDCQPIVPSSMPVASEGAQEIDDAQWTNIVVQSLQTRSPQAREALLKALQNDEPARWTGSLEGMEPDWGIGGPRVLGDAAAAHDRTPASAEISTCTVHSILPLRSNASAKASDKDRLNGHEVREGSMPLLGLELPIIENTGQNSVQGEDSNQSTSRFPLLGTILFAGLSDFDPKIIAETTESCHTQGEDAHSICPPWFAVVRHRSGPNGGHESGHSS